MSNCCVGSVRGDVVIDMLNESRYGEYETLLRNLAEDNEIEFGPNDPKTLHALNILAVILARKKKDAESESIYREVIKICTKVQEKEGENSVYNACKSTAQNNLGCLLISRKDIYESSRLFNEASTLRVGVSGAVGTHTRDITHNQANVEFMKGNYSLAADLYRNSLHCRSPATTSRNFQTCECERSLADSLQRAGKFADAEAVYKRLLTELDLIVGVGHIYSSKCRNQLASALLHQDKLQEAEAVLRDNLSIAESNLEVGDTTKTSALYILKLKSKLAALLVKQKKYDFAEKMYSEALSPDMPETYDALAVCLIQQGKLTEASQFYTTVLESRESSLGPDHPQTIHAVCIFGDLHLRANNFLAALASFRRALCVYERELGSENILTLTAVDNVGAISEKLDLLPEAECMLSRALAGYEKLLGVNHVQWARVGRRLANLYKRQNRSAEAEGILLRILNQVIGMSDLERIRTANSIAILQKKQGKLEEAEGMYLCALTCYEAASPASPSSSLCREDYLSTLNNLGLLYKTIRDYPRSREYYDRAHIGRQQLLGENHPETLCTMANIAVLLTDQEDLQAAETYFQKVLDGFEATCGADNAETKRARHNLSVLQKRKRSRTDP